MTPTGTKEDDSNYQAQVRPYSSNMGRLSVSFGWSSQLRQTRGGYDPARRFCYGNSGSVEDHASSGEWSESGNRRVDGS
jgi:hypothetical protein